MGNDLGVPMDAIRARAREHEAELDSVRWFTVADLAKRWRVSATTVRLIPIEQLEYKEFGTGEHMKRRRYKAAWVERYENATGRPSEDAA